MNLKNEQDILDVIYKDDWMMGILRTVKQLNLPDVWVCAGFVRSKIWDTLHGFSKRTPMPDVDVIYFDESNLSESEEKRLEEQLFKMHPNVPWSVKNEARMHLTHGIEPYLSSVDAIAKFPETATSLGLRLDADDELILTAPHGVEDVLKLEVKPTKFFKENQQRLKVYEKRVLEKNWQSIWGKLKIYEVQKGELR